MCQKFIFRQCFINNNIKIRKMPLAELEGQRKDKEVAADRNNIYYTGLLNIYYIL